MSRDNLQVQVPTLAGVCSAGLVAVHTRTSAGIGWLRKAVGLAVRP